MAGPSSPSLPPAMGWMLVEQFSEDTTLSPLFRSDLTTQADRVYRILESDSLDESQLIKLGENLALLTNVFRTYSHSANKDLGDIQKLKLMHAFQDISNEVKLRLVEEKIHKAEETKQQGWGEWGWNQASMVSEYAKDWWQGTTHVTEDELIGRIEEFQKCMENPDLEISLAKVKENIANKLQKLERMEEAEAVENLELVNLQDFLKLVSVLEEIHDLKSETVQDLQLELSKSSLTKAYEYLVDIVDSGSEALVNTYEYIADQTAEIGSNVTQQIHKAAVEYKDEKIREAVQPLKPQAFFEGHSFKELVEEIVDEAVANNITESKIIRNLAKKGAEPYRKNLAANMEVITQERNTARLGTRFNNHLETVLEAIKQSNTETTDAEFLARLGASEKSVREYKRAVHKRATNNIAKLITEPEKTPSKEAKFLGAKIFLAFVKRVGRFFKQIKHRMTKRFMKKYIDPLNTIKQFLPKDVASMRNLIRVLGLEEEIDTYDKHSELVTYYLLDKLFEDLADIAAEKTHRGEDLDPADEESLELAIEEFKESVKSLGSKIADFKPKESGGIVQEGIYYFIGLLGSVAEKQGVKDSIFDFSTPAIQELAPAWKEWLTE